MHSLKIADHGRIQALSADNLLPDTSRDRVPVLVCHGCFFPKIYINLHIIMYIKSNMITTTMSGFRKEMKKYLDLVTRDYETLIINRGKDNGVVVISVEEYNSIRATEHELSSRLNEKRLESAIHKLEGGASFEQELIDP